MSDAYAELAELAEAAADLAEQGRVEELDPIFARSGAIAASLPARPPRSARPQLERAAAAQERLGTALGASLDATRAELALLDRGRRAARSYGGPVAAGLDLQA